MVSTNDVSIQVVNSSYTESTSGKRNFTGTVNYSINNLNSVPLGTEIIMYIQFSQTDGITTQLVRMYKTLDSVNGSFVFSNYDKPSYDVLTNATMRAEVFFWLRDTQTPISLSAGIQADLVVETPIDPTPQNNMLSLSFSQLQYIDKDLSGSIIVNKTSNWQTFFNDKSLTLFIQIKDLAGTTIDLTQIQFSMDNLEIFTHGINKIYQADTIIVEAYVWIGTDALSQKITSSLTNQLTEPEIDVPPTVQNVLIQMNILGSTFERSYIISPIDYPAIETWKLTLPASVEFMDTLTTTNPSHSALAMIAEYDTWIIQNPPVDSSINDSMIAQSIGFFEIKDGRLLGDINYIANTSFNPFWYSKTIKSFVQWKTESGVTIGVKSNNLNFTLTERDENINIDEGIGNFTKLIVEFFVFDSGLTTAKAFTPAKTITVEEQIDEIEPCQTGFHRVSGICVLNDPPAIVPQDKHLGILKGMLVGSLALALLGSQLPKTSRRKLQ